MKRLLLFGEIAVCLVIVASVAAVFGTKYYRTQVVGIQVKSKPLTAADCPKPPTGAKEQTVQGAVVNNYDKLVIVKVAQKATEYSWCKPPAVTLASGAVSQAQDLRPGDAVKVSSYFPAFVTKIEITNR